MYGVGAKGPGRADHDAGTQSFADQLTGLAAAASHAAATEAHPHAQQLNQLNHLAQQHQLAQLSMSYQQAARMPSNMPVPPGSLMGAPGAQPEVKPELPPSSRTKKRRQSQARLVQNAEAQKRYRSAHLTLTERHTEGHGGTQGGGEKGVENVIAQISLATFSMLTL